jgi:phospholipase D1/2
VNLAVLDGLVCDPEQPIAAEKLIAEFVPEHVRSPAQRALRGLAAALLAVLAAAALWRLSAQQRDLGLSWFAGALSWLRHLSAALPVVLAAFVVGALLLIPGTLLAGATVLVYGWPRGGVYAFLGILLSAALTYAGGRLLPRARIHRRWGPQRMWLRGQLRRGRVVPLALARLVPVANFAVMGIVAGSLRVKFTRYLLGTAIGVTPGLLALALLVHRVARALRDPGVTNLLLLLLVLAAMGGALYWLARRLAAVGAVARRTAALARSGDR